MMRGYHLKSFAVCLAMGLLVGGYSSRVMGSAIAYNAAGDVYSQNFDALPNAPENTSLQGSAQQWADDVSLADWQIWHSGTGGTEGGPAGHQRFRIGPGSSSTGSMYSFGSSGSSDRALGCLSSSVIGEGRWGTRFVNNTGAALTEFTLSYSGEQWRDGGSTNPGGSVAQTASFEYSMSADVTDVGHGTWTDVPQLALTSPVFGASSGVAVNGNTLGNYTLISFTVTGIDWQPGATLWIRWRDMDHTGNDHALAVDDLSFSAVPEPATLGLLVVGCAVMMRRRSA